MSIALSRDAWRGNRHGQSLSNRADWPGSCGAIASIMGLSAMGMPSHVLLGGFSTGLVEMAQPPIAAGEDDVGTHSSISQAAILRVQPLRSKRSIVVQRIRSLRSRVRKNRMHGSAEGPRWAIVWVYPTTPTVIEVSLNTLTLLTSSCLTASPPKLTILREFSFKNT